MKTTRIHLVPMSRMRGAITPLPNKSSWLGALIKQDICLHGVILS